MMLTKELPFIPETTNEFKVKVMVMIAYEILRAFTGDLGLNIGNDEFVGNMDTVQNIVSVHVCRYPHIHPVRANPEDIELVLLCPPIDVFQIIIVCPFTTLHLTPRNNKNQT